MFQALLLYAHDKNVLFIQIEYSSNILKISDNSHVKARNLSVTYFSNIISN